jgi:hypothetical protein
MSRNSKRKRQSIGQTMGGVIVGFDQLAFRTTPPPHELVEKGAPIRGLTGQDGSDLTIVLPDDSRTEDEAEAEPGANG